MPEQSVSYLRSIVESGTCYVLFMFMAIWGGTAAYMSRIKRSGLSFSLVELIGEWSISGFSGLVTALICQSYGVGFYITGAAVGISGHMGGRLIFLLERWGQQYVESRLGIKPGSVDE
jgi:hypothetical protein